MTGADRIRPVGEDETGRILAIINSAAEAYRGKIPDDCWHEPYMSEAQLRFELAAGVGFSGIDDAEGELVAVMGVQPVLNVDLIRHAYVLPGRQGEGLGGRLIEGVLAGISGQILVGTWRAAEWAIRFYEAHGFVALSEAITPRVLRTYWSIPDRQVVTSTVLARPGLDDETARRLIEGARPRVR